MKILAIAVALALLFVLAVVNLQVPTLRFSLKFLNDLFELVVVLIPLLVGLVAWSAVRNTALRIIVCAPFPVLSLIALLLAGMVELEPIASLDGPSSRFVAYLGNGGATTSFWVTVREERTVLPGLVRVRDVASQYRSDKAKLSLTSSGDIEVSFYTWEDGDPRWESRIVGAIADR